MSSELGNGLPETYTAADAEDIKLCLAPACDIPFIWNADRVTSAFGGSWPCFHDADIREVRLSAEECDFTARFEVVKRDWERTDAEGYFIETHRGDVTMKFGECYVLGFEGMNPQNQISDILMQRGTFSSAYGSYAVYSFRVEAPGLTGAGFELLCRSIAVTDVSMKAIEL